MKALTAVKEGLDKVLRLACVVLFVAMILLVTWQVFTRQVLNHSSTWSEEYGKYTFIWLSLLGAAYVIGEKDDVAIDFLVRKMPPAVVRVVEAVAHLVVATFAAWVMVWGGFRIAKATWDDVIPVLAINMGPVYSIVVISGGLILFYSLYHIVHAFTKEARVYVNPDDIDDWEIPAEEGI